jgi:hypothetical protein
MFSRILGQAMGAAAFGGVLNASLSPFLTSGEDLATKIMTPAGRAALPPDSAAAIISGFDHALHVIFLILVALSIFVITIGLMLPKGRGIRK